MYVKLLALIKIVFIVVVSALEEINTTEILQVLVYFDSPLTTIQGKDLSNKVFPPELGNKVKNLAEKSGSLHLSN